MKMKIEPYSALEKLSKQDLEAMINFPAMPEDKKSVIKVILDKKASKEKSFPSAILTIPMPENNKPRSALEGSVAVASPLNKRGAQSKLLSDLLSSNLSNLIPARDFLRKHVKPTLNSAKKTSKVIQPQTSVSFERSTITSTISTPLSRESLPITFLFPHTNKETDSRMTLLKKRVGEHLEDHVAPKNLKVESTSSKYGN